MGASCAARPRRFRLSHTCAALERAVPAEERSFGSVPVRDAASGRSSESYRDQDLSTPQPAMSRFRRRANDYARKTKVHCLNVSRPQEFLFSTIYRCTIDFLCVLILLSIKCGQR